MEDTTAGGRGAAVDASLVNGLAGDTGVGIDVIMALQEGEDIINIRGNKLCVGSGENLENQFQ